MTRPWQRTYTTGEAILAFGRLGVPISKMSRALVVSAEQVERTCERAIAAGDMQMMPPHTDDDKRSAVMVELVHLRQTIDDKDALLREYQGKEDTDYVSLIGIGLGNLTPSMAHIMRYLMMHGRASKERLYAYAWADGRRPKSKKRNSNEPPDPKILDVQICKMRKRLTPLGIAIETVWGFGYEISKETRDRVRELTGQSRPEDRPEYPALLADAQARQRNENLDGSPRRYCIALAPDAPSIVPDSGDQP